MSRRLFGVAGAAAVMAIIALPAAADPPTHERDSFTGAVTDQGQACGFPLSWEFTGDVLISTFVEDGAVVRLHIHVRESGTVTRLDTNEVVELPRTAFVDRILFQPDGSIIVQDLGLSVRVTGPDVRLLDVGRFVASRNPNVFLHSAGQHPIREINPFSVSDPALLGAFCGLFD